MKTKIIGGLFFALLLSLNLSAQTNFKVLSYNVLKGLQGDSATQNEYVKWVRNIDPDIIAYQEMNNFTPESIEQFAARYGHSYAVISKTDGFPVALSSKYPIVNVQKVVDNMWHAYLYANINNVHVFVIHFSPFSYQKRQAEVKEVLARAALVPKNEKVMIMGDFNSLSDDDAAMYNEEFILSQKEKEEKQSHIRNLNNGKIDYTVVGAVKEAGYKDALRLFHTDFQKSCPTRKYGSKFPKRIDYMWINPKLVKSVKAANIIYDDVTDRISDHYPVLVTFDLQ
ncbi:MAG: endonuclease/exonuclease/phosphatase family protein [Prolixibacteraceae bacterium]|nr:endonuclease/exonuclease/phosphatase family protein [Prolixibacteraceae bacterium]